MLYRSHKQRPFRKSLQGIYHHGGRSRRREVATLPHCSSARGCLGDKTGSYLYLVVEDMKRDDCRNPFKKRSF